MGREEAGRAWLREKPDMGARAWQSRLHEPSAFRDPSPASRRGHGVGPVHVASCRLATPCGSGAKKSHLPGLGASERRWKAAVGHAPCRVARGSGVLWAREGEGGLRVERHDVHLARSPLFPRSRGLRGECGCGLGVGGRGVDETGCRFSPPARAWAKVSIFSTHAFADGGAALIAFADAGDPCAAVWR